MSVSVVLQKHILQELTIRNEIIDLKNAPFQLKPEIRFQVFQQKEKRPIATELTVEIGNMDDGTPLYIKLHLRGLFMVIAKDVEETKIDAKEFHKQAFMQLFKVARSILSGTTLMGGMMPFELPPINPENINIQKND